MRLVHWNLSFLSIPCSGFPLYIYIKPSWFMVLSLLRQGCIYVQTQSKLGIFPKTCCVYNLVQWVKLGHQNVHIYTSVFPVMPLSAMLCTGAIIIPSLSVAVKDFPRSGNSRLKGKRACVKVSLPEGLFPAPVPAGNAVRVCHLSPTHSSQMRSQSVVNDLFPRARQALHHWLIPQL